MADDDRAFPLAFSTLNHAPMFGAAPALGEQVRAAQDAGYDAVSLDVFSLRAAWAAGGAAALAAVAELGLPVLDVSALAVGPDPAAAALALEELRGFVGAVGPAWVLVKLEGPVHGAVLAHLHRAASLLAEDGVRVAVEPSPMGSTRTLAEGARVLDEAGVGSLGAGLVLDSWHFFVGSDDWPDLVAAPMARIAYLQLADGHRPAGDDLLAATLHERELPGAGSFDLDRFLATLGRGGWRGPVCVEVLSEPLRRREVARFATEAHEAARTLLDRAALVAPAAPVPGS